MIHQLIRGSGEPFLQEGMISHMANSSTRKPDSFQKSGFRILLIIADVAMILMQDMRMAKPLNIDSVEG